MSAGCDRRQLDDDAVVVGRERGDGIRDLIRDRLRRDLARHRWPGTSSKAQDSRSRVNVQPMPQS